MSTVTGTQDLQWPISSFTPTIGGFQAISWVLGTSDEILAVVLDSAPPGLVPHLTVSIITFDGTVTVYFPTAMNIEEVPAGSGRYVATVSKPDIGHYWVVWNLGVTTARSELTVLPDSIVQTPMRLTSFAEYSIKAGDLEPSLLLTLRNAGGTAVDLTAAVSVTATVQRAGDLAPVVAREVVILDPADDGQIVLDWLEGETDLPGIYRVECNVLWPTAGTSTAPSRAAYRFVIEEAAI